MGEYRQYYRRNLPHYQPRGATLFVTCRLAGSLPASVVQRLQEELEFMRATIARGGHDREQAEELDKEYRRAFGRFDALLDKGETGPRWLADPAIARLVADDLHMRDGHEWRLVAYCIMLNHVHIVLTPQTGRAEEPFALAELMRAFKGCTARAANVRLGRRGAFWQHESYDHVVRDQDELARIVSYVKNNPVKAGLVAGWDEWPWTYTTA